jgi:nicotinamidase-related amidase
MTDREELVRKYAEIYDIDRKELSREEIELLIRADKEYRTATPRDVFLPLPKGKTALLVIDLQEDFVAKGAGMWIPQNLRMIPKIKTLIMKCRKVGVPVIYTEHVHHPSGMDKGLMWDVPLNKAIKTKGACRERSPGSKVYHEISPLSEEKVIHKHRYSAFYNTDLEIILRGLKTTHLIICGCMTNYCCGATARDAFFRDFKVIFGSDITVTDNPYVHEAELMTLRRGYALVLTFEEIMKELDRMEEQEI